MVKIKVLTKTNIRSSRLPLVIGYFSCIHVMHVQLLTKYHLYNVLTFKDFYTKKKNAIYSFNQRIDNIAKYNPANIFIWDLNKNNMTALDFIIQVLKPMNPSEIVVGDDFKFGSDHKGVEFLKNYFKVSTIKYNKHISTTQIVSDVRNNKLTEANNFLDEPYFYVSKWIRGRKLGRTIGFKTINLKVDDQLIVPDGSYITVIELGKKKYQSISFLGTSHSTGSKTRTLEVHVLNKKIGLRPIYPRLIRNHVKLSFWKFIRKNRKFASAQKLSAQIQKDKSMAIKYFKETFK